MRSENLNFAERRMLDDNAPRAFVDEEIAETEWSAAEGGSN
jgi:hypothetical protein